MLNKTCHHWLSSVWGSKASGLGRSEVSQDQGTNQRVTLFQLCVLWLSTMAWLLAPYHRQPHPNSGGLACSCFNISSVTVPRSGLFSSGLFNSPHPPSPSKSKSNSLCLGNLSYLIPVGLFWFYNCSIMDSCWGAAGRWVCVCARALQQECKTTRKSSVFCHSLHGA